MAMRMVLVMAMFWAGCAERPLSLGDTPDAQCCQTPVGDECYATNPASACGEPCALCATDSDCCAGLQCNKRGYCLIP
jgi:hypothetical protein